MRLLEVRALDAFYGDFQALFGVDVDVDAGETIAIIGANGAGKSTLLRAIAGSIASAAPMIRWQGRAIGHLAAHEVVRLGIALVPEGRRLFPSLTVEENLRVGGYAGRPGAWTVQRLFETFPALAERRAVPATRLSGGEQQMAAIGRALMTNPLLLLCDEVSLGLAPAVIRHLYDTLEAISKAGTTLVLVEQDIQQALAIADRVYCLQEGRVTLSGAPQDLRHDQLRQAYFGL